MSGRFLISAIPAAGFWRCGRHFTRAGVLVDTDAFSSKEWDRLKSEPMLRVREATDDDAADADARAGRIAEAIEMLAAEDFQRDGKPKLDRLNALLGDDFGKVSGSERDVVWASMKENGFEAPTGSD